MGYSKKEFLEDWCSNSSYFDMLRLIAQLSKLFSDNSIPYLDYRVTENLFCKYYNAINDARACMAYDARIGTLGIGIKTFGISGGTSIEKIAEFNKLKNKLDGFKGDELAYELCKARNERIDFANRTYNVSESIYHIVGRDDTSLKIFNTPYKKIDLNRITNVKDSNSSISFIADGDKYSFNKSKSVLSKKFLLPENYRHIDVDILSEPLSVLSHLLDSPFTSYELSLSDIEKPKHSAFKIKGIDYVILPLYSTQSKIHIIPERSGLNQWNAKGRQRDENEVYIPIPARIRDKYPDFFPKRESDFILRLPNGNDLSAKVCQDNGKALMSNPNAALGQWILRTVLKKTPGELVTMEDLTQYGIDSILIEDTHDINDIGQKIYTISFTSESYESYEDFIE